MLARGGPVGLGHLARSTALAQALELRGSRLRRLAVGASDVVEIDGSPWTPDPWPGAEAVAADLAIGDGYDLLPSRVDRLGRRARAWMHEPPAGAESAIVVDPAGEPGRLRLTGPGYACLRRAYWSRQPQAPSDRVSEVLVTIGGGDAGGSLTDLSELVRASAGGARVTMVRGPQSGASAPSGIDVAEAPGSLEPLFAGSDLVVTGAGQTMLESLACGVATIALVRADDQWPQAKLASTLGGVELVEPAGLALAVRSLCGDGERRAALAARGPELLDGLGAHRVADFVIGKIDNSGRFAFGPVSLRAAGYGDGDLLIEVRNDPAAYPFYGVPRQVGAAEHRGWLARMLDDPERDLMIVEVAGDAVGQIRLDPTEEATVRELSVALLPAARGRGLGRAAIAAGSALAWIRRGAAGVHAAVHPDNATSRGAFAAVGFEPAGRTAAGFDDLRMARWDFRWPAAGPQ